MGDERISDLASRADDHVEHARGQPRLLENPRERHDRCRRVARGLDHDGVPGDERRHRFPRGDRHREVPRRDEGADAQRLPDAHRELVRQLRRRGETEEAAALARREVGHVDRFLHVAARLGEDLSHLARHQPRELFLVTLQDLAGGVENLGAPGSGRVAPSRIGLPGGGDRRLDVLESALGKDPDEVVSIGRVAVLERLPGGRGRPLAADEVALQADGDLGRHPPVPGGDGRLAGSSGLGGATSGRGGTIGRFERSSVFCGVSGRVAASLGITTRPWI